MRCTNEECENPSNGSLTDEDFSTFRSPKDGRVLRRKMCKVCTAKKQQQRRTGTLRHGFADMTYQELKECTFDMISAQKWLCSNVSA